MKYTSNDIQIILIHPVVSAGQGGTKVVDHPVYIILEHISLLNYNKLRQKSLGYFQDALK